MKLAWVKIYVKFIELSLVLTLEIVFLKNIQYIVHTGRGKHIGPLYYNRGDNLSAATCIYIRQNCVIAKFNIYSKIKVQLKNNKKNLVPTKFV